MNQQEQTRLQVLTSVLEYHLSKAQAAEIMGVSERLTERLLAVYRKEGLLPCARCRAPWSCWAARAVSPAHQLCGANIQLASVAEWYP